jgi:hypothetical protein
METIYSSEILVCHGTTRCYNSEVYIVQSVLCTSHLRQICPTYSHNFDIITRPSAIRTIFLFSTNKTLLCLVQISIIFRKCNTLKFHRFIGREYFLKLQNRKISHDRNKEKYNSGSVKYWQLYPIYDTVIFNLINYHPLHISVTDVFY